VLKRAVHGIDPWRDLEAASAGVRALRKAESTLAG
jgi:hypothetical protein